MKQFRWIMAVFCFWQPAVLSVVVAGALANVLGCKVDEGSIHPCHLFGISIGPLLYELGVLGWLMLASLPLGAFALVIWIVVESVRLVRKHRAK